MSSPIEKKKKGKKNLHIGKILIQTFFFCFFVSHLALTSSQNTENNNYFKFSNTISYDDKDDNNDNDQDKVIGRKSIQN